MPKMQIDGIDVAELDATLAEKLRRMVSLHGVGRNQKPATPQPQQSVSLRMGKPPVGTFIYFPITLEFPRSAAPSNVD